MRILSLRLIRRPRLPLDLGIALLLSTLLAAAGAECAEAPPPPVPKPPSASPGFTPRLQQPQPSDPLQFLRDSSRAAAITADELLEDRERKRVIGRGFADLRYLGKRLQADYIEIQTETREGVATGNIVFQTRNDRIVGSRADFNLDTEHVVIYDARGYVAATYYVTGNVIRRISHDRYEVIGGTFTTCEGETPTWAFNSRKSTFQIEGYAHLQVPVITIKGIPAAALPYAILPVKTKRATGFLTPGIGNGSRSGFEFSPRFFWAINDWSDATFGLDYFTKRGIRYKGEYRYALSGYTRGQINATTLKDKVEKTTFSTFKAFHISGFPESQSELKVFIDEATHVPQDRLLAGSLDERTRQETDSRVTFVHELSGIPGQFQVGMRRREGLQESEGQLFQKLPEVLLNVNQAQIGSSDFRFNLNSSVVSFRRVEDRNTTSLVRTDLEPSVSLPLQTVPWLGVTPKVGIRHTYWSDRKIDPNVGPNPTSDEQEQKALFREMWFASLNVVGPRFSRVYKGDIGPFQDFKHIFSFETTYDYVPAMDGHDRRLIIPIDDVDTFEDRNTITYSFINRVLTKVKGDEGVQTRQLLTASLTQTADIAEARRKQNLATNPRHPFGNVVLTMSSRPISLLRLTHSSEYNVYEGEIDLHSTGFLLDGGRNWYLSVDRTWSRQRSRGDFPHSGQSFINFAGGIAITPRWFFEYMTRLNKLTNTTLEQSIILRYRGCCWGFNLTFTDTPETSEVFFTFLIRGILEGEEAPTFKRSRSVTDEGRFLGGGTISPLPFEASN